MTKKDVRQLAKDVNEVMEKYAISSYMNSLMGPCEDHDHGPNFKPLIEKWKLTRKMLLEAINFAYQFSILFDNKVKLSSKRHCPPWNKWQDTYYNFHAILEAGELND